MNIENLSKIWLEIVLALKAYDNAVLSGFKTVGTIIVLAVVIWFLPETKLSTLVEVLSIGNLFAIQIAKRSKTDV